MAELGVIGGRRGPLRCPLLVLTISSASSCYCHSRRASRVVVGSSTELEQKEPPVSSGSATAASRVQKESIGGRVEAEAAELSHRRMFPFPTEKSSRGSVALFISNLYDVFTDPKVGKPSPLGYLYRVF